MKGLIAAAGTRARPQDLAPGHHTVLLTPHSDSLRGHPLTHFVLAAIRATLVAGPVFRPTD